MRRLLIWGLLLCSMAANAQSRSDSTATAKDPLYLQGFIGINKSANENLPWTEFTGYPWSGGLFFAIGQEMTPQWGWRVALRINHNKSRNVRTCESKDTWGWNNTGLFADATYDVTDALFRNNKAHKLNLKAFAGIGAAYTWKFDSVALSYAHPYSRSSKLLPAVRAGLTARWSLTDKWHIGAEVSQTIFEDHFNGVAHGAPLDTRTNIKVGVTYLFAKSVKTKKSVYRKNKLKECPELPLLMPGPEDVKIRQIKGRAFLDFPVNEMTIYPDYRNNPSELARIKATVDSALFDQSITITQISLHGYASPESPYSNNTRLAKGRTESLKNYLIHKFGFQSQLFSSEYTPEDWDNLRGFLNNIEGRRVKGDFWYDNKTYFETPEVPFIVQEFREDLLKIIDADMENLDAKEELLKQVGRGEPYKWLLKYVYPGLRHTDYIITYQVKQFPVKVSRKLIYTHPEALSLKEFYMVAMDFGEGTDGWVDALLLAAQQFPEDETANLNAACACVKTHRFMDARKYLRKAGKTEQAIYLGQIIKAMEGDAKWRIENDRLIIIEE